MRTRWLGAILLFVGIGMFGCDFGGAPGDEDTGGDGGNSLVSVLPEPSGTNCADGGRLLQTGFDEDSDYILDPSEVTSSEYFCNGSGTENPLNGINLDFNGGVLPEGWTSELIRSGPGLVNDRLQGDPIDSGGYVRTPVLQSTAYSLIEVQMDAEILYSYHGAGPSVFLEKADGTFLFLSWSYAQKNYGAYKLTFSGTRQYGTPYWWSEVDSVPPLTLNSGTGKYRFNVIVIPEHAKLVATHENGGTVEFDLDLPFFDISEIVGIGFGVYTTTDNPVWMDNVSVSAW